MKNTEYEEVSSKLEKNDMLFIFTDGVSSSENMMEHSLIWMTLKR